MTVEEYLSNVTPSQKLQYERLRKIVNATVPDVEEAISYGMPTFKYKGKFLIYWGAFKDHMSLFPGPQTDRIKEQLHDFKMAKGTIQFTEDKPVPEAIIKDLILTRQADIDS